MKKFLMMVIAVFTMTLAANATDYTGKVTDVQMGSKNPTVEQIITFSVEGVELTGDFSITSMFPPHDIYLTANIDGEYFVASGTATVFGVKQVFKGHITLLQLDNDTLKFTFVGATGENGDGTPVAFTFEGTAQ